MCTRRITVNLTFFQKACAACLLLFCSCSPTINGSKPASETAATTQESAATTSVIDRGQWNMNTTSWPGAGYYSALISDLGPSDVCSSKSLFGAAGAAVCQSGTTATPADATKILATHEAWDSAGTKFTGTLPNRTSGGSWDMATAFPGEGYYAGASNPPQASQIVSGNTILGVAGSAGSSLSDFAYSAVHRDPGASILTLSGETGTGLCSLPAHTSRKSCETAGGSWTPGALPAGYREVPSFVRDDEGYAGFAGVTPLPLPTVPCGTAGSLEERIQDCGYTWDGTAVGNGGFGKWKLVTSDGVDKDVWRDEQTGLLWGQSSSTSLNWCRATGNTEGKLGLRTYSGIGNGTITFPVEGGATAQDELITLTALDGTTFTVSGSSSGALPNAIVGAAYNNTRANFTLVAGSTPFQAGDSFTLQSSTINCRPGSSANLQPATPVSACYEDVTLSPAIPGENWGNGTYDAAKGGMGLNSATKVRWRLPTIYDYQLANTHGLRFLARSAGLWEWSATTYAPARSSAHQFRAPTGLVQSSLRSNSTYFRCVGR